MTPKVWIEDSKSANGYGGHIKPRRAIAVPVGDVVPSFKSGVGIGNKAAVYSRPLMHRRTALFYTSLHNNRVNQDRQLRCASLPACYPYR